MQKAMGAFATVRANLPHGGGLPEVEWKRRHRALIAVLWGATLALLPYSLAEGYGAEHTALHLGPVVTCAALANVDWLSRRAQSALVALGLMAASAVFVHASHGLIEAHFAFFVFIVALTVYEDWLPFLIAVGFVLLHHGIYGMIDPSGVYDQPGQASSPWYWASIHAGFVAAAGLAGVIAWRFNEDVRRDIQRLASEKQELADDLAAMAHEDWLTGLPNRRAWDQRFGLELERAKRAQVPITVGLLDVDGLKEVNDTGGHQSGDRLLKTLAARWAGSLRPSDFIARLGGDEFALILFGCDADAAAELLERLRDGAEHTWSIGLATWDGAESEADLMRRADEVLYGNKPTARAAQVAPARVSPAQVSPA
jgi:diguanylate cyclase (GGDEF)-like protein